MTVRSIWVTLPEAARLELFRNLPSSDQEDLFLELGAADQQELLHGQPPAERRRWLRLLPPDEAADLVQLSQEWLELLDPSTRKEVTALLAYAEDHAGGLMSPRFVRLRPDMTVDEAIPYLRKQRVETIYTLYVLDAEQRLLGVLSLRELMAAPGATAVRDIMHVEAITARPDLDQEALSRLFVHYRLPAIPIVDDQQRMQGVVTLDDIVDVVQEEATDDIHKMGGVETLDAPYFQVGFLSLMRKRGGWLTALFLGEMLTATAMAHYEAEIARAVVLALFLPLIISSGGNSGSQASTLIIRAMALDEVRLRDAWRVLARELAAGVCLGALLGGVGLLRVTLWQAAFHSYGPQAAGVALTVGLSLVGVVTFGTLCGALLPFGLKRLGLDPATASAPLVATLVDVSGLVIYFSVASLILR